MRRPTTKNPVILPSQERSRQTFEAILEATTYLLQRRGMQNFTSNDIATRAGVNINSFYQYFLNKSAVLRLIAERHIAENEAEFAISVRRAKDLNKSQAFMLIIDDMLRLFLTQREFRREILFNMPLIVGPARQHQVRFNTAKVLSEFIPPLLYKEPKHRIAAAQMLIHTFMGAVVLMLDPSFSESERLQFQTELRHLIFRYVGITEESPFSMQNLTT